MPSLYTTVMVIYVEQASLAYAQQANEIGYFGFELIIWTRDMLIIWYSR